MNKYQALLIRACKSNNAQYRIKRLYKMIYFGGKYDASHVASILSRIVEEYNLTNLQNLIHEMNPNQGWKYGADDNTSYEERAILLLSSIIRLTEVSQLPDYPIPAKFRNK